MIDLRNYQQHLVGGVRAAFRDRKRCPLVVLSTGGGKTIIFSYITQAAAAKGNPVLIAAHRREIIRQISLSLARFGVEHQIVAPAATQRQIMVAHFKAFGRSYVKAGSKTLVGSVQTIVTRFEVVDAAFQKGQPLIVMDEGHHVVEDTGWGKVMERYENALGLIVTASPERLDGRGLGKGEGGYADTLIEGPPPSWLIENGYLSPYLALTAPQQIDMAGVHTRMGEFVPAETEARVDKPKVTGDAIEHYQKHAAGMRAVVFCVSVAHSQHVAAEFTAAGIPAAHIDGGLDDSERDQAICDFADGRITVLCNVGLVSEGFDLASIAQKDVTIDCIIDLAPTQSLVNAMQRWGRALRPAPGKRAVLLDHAGNMHRHGLPDDDREWTLEGRRRAKRAANDNEKDVPIRTCGRCFTIHRPAPVCPSCGFVYPAQDRSVEVSAGELQEIQAEQMRAERRAKLMQQGQADTVEKLVAQGISKGRALKIIAAREEKTRLRAELVDLRPDLPLRELLKMKPKELRSEIEKARELVAA